MTKTPGSDMAETTEKNHLDDIQVTEDTDERLAEKLLVAGVVFSMVSTLMGFIPFSITHFNGYKEIMSASVEQTYGVALLSMGMLAALCMVISGFMSFWRPTTKSGDKNNG